MSSDAYAQFIRHELSFWPGVDVEFCHRSKHRQATFHYAGKTRFIVYPDSPSDGARGHLNMVADMRKELATLGAEREQKRPSVRKRKNRVVGRRMPSRPDWTSRIEKAPVRPNPFDALAAMQFAPPAPEVPPMPKGVFARLWLWITASVDRNPKGEDPQGLRAKHESAVGEAETPYPGRITQSLEEDG